MKNTSRTFWSSKENVVNSALHYATRSEFMKSSGAAYAAARNNGWLDEVCSHMVANTKPSKRAVYVIMFPNNTAYVGMSTRPEARLKSHRTGSSNPAVQKSIEEYPNYKEEVLDGWYSAEEASTAEKDAIDKLEADGYTILNIVKTGGGYWTKERVAEEARKYKTRSAFSKGSPGACFAARNKGWTAECVAHMHTPRKPDSRVVIEARSSLRSEEVNVGGIKIGVGIKFFRSDIEDLDYIDRIGVLELMEDVSLGKAEADPMKAYEGVVTAINNDGTATVELSNYDDNSMYEDGLGSVRDVDFDFLFVIS